MLIVFGGLPGTGKTTIARALAKQLGAFYLRIDTIEQALRSVEGSGTEVGSHGYAVAYHVAEDNLRVGRDVVADSVNPIRETRDAWRSVASRTPVKIVEVEVICSNLTEHQFRISSRKSDIPGLKLPSWQDVLDREYEAWDRPHLVIDTASKTVEHLVTDLLARLNTSQ